MSEVDKAKEPTQLAPILTLESKFFWDGATREEFVCEKCSDCGAFRYPPRPMCPHCHSVKRDITPLSGKGKVLSWIKPVHPKPIGFDAPPTVAVVEVAEGFRLVTNIIDIAFEDITAEMPVEVAFAPTIKNKKVPVFKPASK